MAANVASARIKSVQRIALAMLVLSGCVNYVDRATLAIANPYIREDLGISVASMGLLLSAFLWAYAFSQLPTGALVDRLGPRRLLSLGLTIWSAAQFAGGLVGSFGQFFGARVALGIGEAPQFPTGSCATGSTCASGVPQPACSTVPQPLAPPFRRRCSPG
jgi:MFS family permease